MTRYYFLNKYKNEINYAKYYNLDNIVVNGEVPIFHLFGGLYEDDVEQAGVAKQHLNVSLIPLNSPCHAPGISANSYVQLLLAEPDDIKALCIMNQGQTVDIPLFEKQIQRYLETVKVTVRKFYDEKDKKEAYLNLLGKWLLMRQNHRKPEVQSETVYAIWGSGNHCKLLINELRELKCEKIKCIIESNPSKHEYEGYPVLKIEKMPSDVDCIIVIPYYDINSIKEKVYMFRQEVRVIGIDEWLEGVSVI